MTATQGLHIRKDGTTGTTPVDARLAMAGLVASTGGFGGRPGVLSGCAVSGTTGWAYSVAAGHLVTSRSAGDGVVLWSVSSATSVPTSPSPGSGSRIDVIYAMHHDLDNSDDDNLPVLDVVQGTAAADPSAPSIPAGAIELGRFTVPSGATSTQGATFDGSNVQYTAARGAPIPVTGTAQRNALTSQASPANPITVSRRDTGAEERSIGTSWDTGGLWVPYTPVLAGTTTNPGVSSAEGRYTKIGRTVTGWATFTLSSGGSGTFTISLPQTSAADGASKAIGSGYAVDVSASNLRAMCELLLASSGSAVSLQFHGATNSASSGIPWAWASGDIVRVEFSYEAAA